MNLLRVLAMITVIGNQISCPGASGIKGKVLDASANPVADAEVTLGLGDRDETGRTISIKRIAEVTTDSEGRFEFSFTPEDTNADYQIVIRKPGFKMESVRITKKEVDNFSDAFDNYTIFLEVDE